MSDTLIACCPSCGWDNDGALRACVAYDTGYVERVQSWLLFADGEVDADQDSDGEGGITVHVNDVDECPRCGDGGSSIESWVGSAFMRLPGDELHRTLQWEAWLDLIAREEAETQDRAHARRTDPGTSHAAAASVRELTAKQIAVREVFRQHGSMTDEELIDRYSEPSSVRIAWPVQSESGLRTRRSELVRRGELQDTGEKLVMSTGRKAIVWGLA